MKKSLFIFIFLSAALLSACSSYKMDVQQGNVVEESSIGQIERGMSRRQVQATLGTALMQDDFHANRWDYVYYFKKAGKKPELRSLAVIFNNDAVSQIIK